MVPILLAVAGAFVYGAADFFGGLAAKRASALLVTAVSAAAGLLGLLAGSVFIGGVWSQEAILWGALSGVTGALAISLLYASLAIGPMSILSPLTAVVSAVVPLTWGLVGGERLGGIGAIAIGVALVAVVLVGFVPERGAVRPSLKGVLFAIGSGAMIGAFMVIIDRTPDDSGLVPLILNRGVNGTIMFAAVLAVWLVSRTRNARVRAAERPIGVRPIDDRPIDGRPIGDRTADIRTAEHRASGSRPAESHAIGNHPDEGQTANDQTANDHTADRHPADGRATAGSPAENRAAHIRPAESDPVVGYTAEGTAANPTGQIEDATRLGTIAVMRAGDAPVQDATHPAPDARSRRDELRHGLMLAVLCGLIDTTANVILLLALRLGELSIVSVLTAMYPAGTIILAAAVLRERIAPVQWAGLVLALVAAGMLALA